MVVINGENVNADGKSIAQYLAEAGYDRRLVAVEKNGEIVSRNSFDGVYLEDGDTVEVVRFVGGG